MRKSRFTAFRPPLGTILAYAAILASATFALEWLQYQHFLKTLSTEYYVILIALFFVLLGGWIGYRLTSKQESNPFERNTAALKSLGISQRELEVLESLANGQSNKEAARALDISPNTVKTHIAHIFRKLEVDKRVLAIKKAKDLRLIP